MRADRAPIRDSNPHPRAPLVIHYLPIESLAPDPNNARVHGRRQVRQIAESIQAFGFNVPVLIDAECRMIAGHGRLEAAKRLGLKQVPTVRLEHLSERAGEEGRLAALHPTVKPTAMIADAILDVTRRGDVVLDSFLGSGSTLMACERTGRRCYGLELDPIYCDVIVRRWLAHTGGVVRLATTGENFDAVAAARQGTDARGEVAP